MLHFLMIKDAKIIKKGENPCGTGKKRFLAFCYVENYYLPKFST